MIDVKQAVKAAVEFVAELYPSAAGVRLEEVEPYHTEWHVVVSFFNGDPANSLTTLVTGGASSRLYKVVRIDNETGEARALKIWKQ